MRVRRTRAIAAGLFLVTSSVGCGSSGNAPATGAVTFNTGTVDSISCPASGECTAGGHSFSKPYHGEAFVVSEKHGRWGSPIEVPGTATLNHGFAGVDSISCPAVGDCAATGHYFGPDGKNRVFVVSEKHGRWGNAIEVPGMAALSSDLGANVDLISCTAAGNCAAGGYYFDRHFTAQAVVVSETNGTWGNAIEVPGTAALNRRDANVSSISCAAAGDCAASGFYTDRKNRSHAFVVTEKNGRWGNAINVPGMATLNTGGNANVGSISCVAVGECAAGGYYTDVSKHTQAFVVTENNGRWGNAINVPGMATLNTGGNAGAGSISCVAVGECAAGGAYTDGSGHAQAFVVTETNGSWGQAIEVPGTATLPDRRSPAGLNWISCAAAGECAASGYYHNPPHLYGLGPTQAFVVSETNGTWGNAIEVLGTAVLDRRDANVSSISCAAAGDCAAGGYYTDQKKRLHAFVIDQKHGSWSNAIDVRSFPGSHG